MDLNKLKSLKESILGEANTIADIFSQGKQQQYDLGDLILNIHTTDGIVENEFLNIDEYTSKDLIDVFKDAYKDIPDTKISGTFHKGGLR